MESVVCAYLEMSLNHIVDVDKVNEESFFLSESVSGNSTTDQFDGSSQNYLFIGTVNSG